MTRIFLHTVSNQYNAYNLILRLMAWEVSSIPNTTEVNTKLQIFSFIPQRQRIQSNFMNHTYQTSKETNKHNPNYQNNDINMGFTTNTKFMLLQQRQHKFRFRNKSINFVHFIYHQFVPFINAKKLVRSLMNNFVHFIHPYMNPLPNYNTCFLTTCSYKRHELGLPKWRVTVSGELRFMTSYLGS